MTSSWDESPVALEKLDDHLKALLRLKIREFVHLSPCFKDVPSVDPTLPTTTFVPEIPRIRSARHNDRNCPNRKTDAPVVRRHVRVGLHASSLM